MRLPRLLYQTPKLQEGQILITILIVVPALILIVAAYMTLSTSGYRLMRQDQLRTMSQMAADAAADYGVEQVNANNGWAGTSGEVTLQTDSMKKVTYSVTMTTNSSSSKTMNITARSYFPANAASPTVSTSIKVDLALVSSGNYSVASGEGGLIMNNSAKITGGDVLVNGTITMSNTAQIGLSTAPISSLQVADAVCPTTPDATYPRLCTSSDHAPQPISITNTAKIYGSVSANNQTTTTGMSSPGLIASSGVAVTPLPTYDRTSQKAAVATTINGGVSCSSGSQTWAANTKIVGNVTLSNSCSVTVNGNVWITGSFSIKNSANLIVGSSNGSTKPVIMVDGLSGASFSNSASLTPNASGTGFEFITYYSKAACSPDCSSVTGTDLYNSRNVTTITLSNTSAGPGTLFYAYWTEVDVKNSGQIGALLGQTINISNTGTITFTTSSGTGTSAWVINGYRKA